MNSGRIGTILIVGVIAAVAMLSLLRNNTDDKGYVEGLVIERQEKDKFMQENNQSPFKAEGINFKELSYYAPDIDYRVLAQLEPIREKKVVVLPTSDGKQNRYLEYAWAEFVLHHQKVKILLLEVMDMGPQRGMLFCAFADSTSGNETYGAGRYLDVKKVKGASTIELDFNKAYNPYCAYVDSYSCPFPPKENVLPVAIKAGEKQYEP